MTSVNGFDAFKVPIPAGAGGKKIHVVGGWYYRKLSRDFVDWAYGVKADIPVARIGDIDAYIPVYTP
jgi:hypothetical protein